MVYDGMYGDPGPSNSRALWVDNVLPSSSSPEGPSYGDAPPPRSLPPYQPPPPPARYHHYPTYTSPGLVRVSILWILSPG